MIISPFQSSFVPKRHIEDNILLGQELLSDINKHLKELNVVLKLDIEKAYDKLDWSFLMLILWAFGFRWWFIDLVYRTLSNNWFSILINGVPIGFFKSFRGVRQGDPLSPILFIVAVEFMTQGIHHLFSHG